MIDAGGLLGTESDVPVIDLLNTKFCCTMNSLALL